VAGAPASSLRDDFSVTQDDRCARFPSERRFSVTRCRTGTVATFEKRISRLSMRCGNCCRWLGMAFMALQLQLRFGGGRLDGVVSFPARRTIAARGWGRPGCRADGSAPRRVPRGSACLQDGSCRRRIRGNARPFRPAGSCHQTILVHIAQDRFRAAGRDSALIARFKPRRGKRAASISRKREIRGGPRPRVA